VTPQGVEQVRVRCFARLKDLVGAESLTIRVAEGETVRDLRRRLGVEYPALAGLLARCAVAVDDEFADDSLRLPANAEVALLPPVSGGCDSPVTIRDRDGRKGARVADGEPSTQY
jgi:molybdopterin synthase catalytic subunit